MERITQDAFWYIEHAVFGRISTLLKNGFENSSIYKRKNFGIKGAIVKYKMTGRDSGLGLIGNCENVLNSFYPSHLRV